MDMPKLQPIPIPTKNAAVPVRMWRWLTSIRQWRLLEDWCYTLPNSDIVIVIPKGFVFDGASIPKPLWFLLSPTGLLLIPGLVHDFAYRYDYLWAFDHQGRTFRYSRNAGQKHWDKLFKTIALDVNGMSVIDYLAYVALSGFGWIAWRGNRKRQDFELIPESPKVTF